MPEELKKLFSNCMHFDPENRPGKIDRLIAILEDLDRSNPWTRKDAEVWWKGYDEYG